MTYGRILSSDVRMKVHAFGQYMARMP